MQNCGSLMHNKTGTVSCYWGDQTSQVYFLIYCIQVYLQTRISSNKISVFNITFFSHWPTWPVDQTFFLALYIYWPDNQCITTVQRCVCCCCRHSCLSLSKLQTSWILMQSITLARMGTINQTHPSRQSVCFGRKLTAHEVTWSLDETNMFHVVNKTEHYETLWLILSLLGRFVQ